MTILHIIDHFSLGGAQRIVEGILAKMPDAVLLPLRKKGSDYKQISIEENRFLHKPSGNFLQQFLNLLKVPAKIREQDIRIVHCHLHYSWVYGLWLYLVMPVRHRPTIIFHEHDSVKISRWYYPFGVRVLSRSGNFIAVSHFIQQHLMSCGVASGKIVLLRNFVDLERFCPGGRSGLSIFGLETRVTLDAKIIGFAGRLVEYKGWRVVLEVADSFPDVYFLIAGDGPDAEKLLKEVHRRGLQDRVFLLGYVQDMGAFYRLLSLLIIPSPREAFGLVQLEAQASGVPVVIYDSEAAREIHGDGSTLLVPAGDVDVLIRKVEELLESPTFFQELVEKGLENVQSYNLENYIKKLNRVYCEILNQ